MSKNLCVRWLLAAMFFAPSAFAELAIEITRGLDKPTNVAVVPMTLQGGGALSEDIGNIVSADLERSGLFRTMSKINMLSYPATARDVYFRDWRIVGMEYVVVGEAVRDFDGRIKVTFSLLEVNGERTLFTRMVQGSERELRDIAHFISDTVYEAITGIPGAFSTRLAYVTATQAANRQITYRLMISDADGARERLMLESRQPLMSPAWSPDGQELVYVSFETRRPAIFRQRLVDAHREQLTNFRGLNGAPSWSPDGRQLALVLSKDGNPEIYLFDLATRAFTRLTNHFAIDTEPSWTPDGRALVFTSDRGGAPQIYRLTIGAGAIERLTFEGSYNSRGQVAPDGRTMVMVHRRDGRYHIATQDIVSGRMRILTETALDESPTVAPNGAMLIYATKQGGKGVLAAVSLDSRVRYILPSRQGDVREPAWSPLLKTYSGQ